MKRLELELVPSVEFDGLVPSFRLPYKQGRGNPAAVKHALHASGFRAGERVVVVPADELVKLEQAAGRRR